MVRNLNWEADEDGCLHSLSDGPVHGYFGLSYANYFVLPRSLMQCMPLEWQQRFVDLANEYWDEWNFEADRSYEVRLRGSNGRWERDELSNYRHPSMALIQSLHREWIPIATDETDTEGEN